MSGFNFGDSPDTDFFGNPKGGGCADSFIILMIVGGLSVYGGIKGIKYLAKNNNKTQPKTEQFINNQKTPANVIAWSNVNCR